MKSVHERAVEVRPASCPGELGWAGAALSVQAVVGLCDVQRSIGQNPR